MPHLIPIQMTLDQLEFVRNALEEKVANSTLDDMPDGIVNLADLLHTLTRYHRRMVIAN